MQQRVLFISALISISFAGCLNVSQPNNPIKYYTLEYASPQLAPQQPFFSSIQVERFSVAPEYNTLSMVYRDKGFQRNTYPYHAWRAGAGDLVSSFIARDLRASGWFKAVLAHDSRLPVAYHLEGSVDQFFEWDTADDWQAVLAVTFTLADHQEPDLSQQVLWQKTYQEKVTCTAKTPTALAEGMSLALSKISAAVAHDLSQVLQQKVALLKASLR